MSEHLSINKIEIKNVGQDILTGSAVAEGRWFNLRFFALVCLDQCLALQTCTANPKKWGIQTKSAKPAQVITFSIHSLHQ